jgi:hypothetical protein
MLKDVRDLFPKRAAMYRHRLECHIEAENIKPKIEKLLSAAACLNLINPAFIPSSILLDKLSSKAQDLVHF